MRRVRIQGSVHREQGMAIIAALLVVIAVAAMAATILERQSLWADVLRTERDHAQAEWVVRGGVDWSRIVLRMDASRSAITTLDGIWAQPLVDLPVGPAADPERVRLSGLIEDAQARYNVRNLARAGQIDPDALERVRTLFGWLDLDPGLAVALARRVAESQPASDRPVRSVGLRDVDDLVAVPGFSPQIVQTLQPFLTVLPGTVPVNANTASAEILGIVVPELGLSGARSLLLERDKGLTFNNRGDFLNRIRSEEKEAARGIGVASHWFRITGEVTVEETVVAFRALLQRDSQGKTIVHWVSYR